MRWLLLKDLQILRRSPLQAALLIAYPVLIALLVGFAISREPGKPSVAFLNEVPEGARIAAGGGTKLPSVGVEDRICARVECVPVASRAAAERKVRSGEVLAALILPADLIDRLNSLSTLNPQTPEVEVLVNEEDPLKAQVVDDRIESLLGQANLLIAKRIAAEGGRYLSLVVDGGSFDVLGAPVEILGLRAVAKILRELRPAVPPSQRAPLDRVIRFATLARDNLDVASPLIDRLAQPIVIDKQSVSAPTPPLEVFAIAVAATLTLTFVILLLVAGSLALEREENTFPRLTRGLVSRSALLGEKVGLGIAVGLVVTLLMLAGVQLFVPLAWERIGLWLVAILLGGAALAAAGAALGSTARDVRAVSLLAFMVSLPIALLSLVPSGAVGAGLYDAIRAVTALFPFKPTLQAMTAALDPAGPGIGRPLLHLAGLTVAYGLIARLALRRFSTV
ncbi:MAG TPA: ABC transporter permease [Solirubrobacterales bacterium]|jgi:ABC-2 type transport system permease protein|nr:ABC transporter permease [Solirubrobacterales bacterium]